MGELHDVLNITSHDLLTQQGDSFIGGIQKITDDISKSLDEVLNIPNSIQVPSDFKMLFSKLDFGLERNGNIYHLKQRGDGIKIRHIPIILKYMAKQEKNLALKGYVNPDTIWGFEEPENNLELKYAFELAEEFLLYLDEIQIFVTTHSPAFYALDKTNDDKVFTYFINKNNEEETQITKITHDKHEIVHEEMGLLPLITPYLEQIHEQTKKLDVQKSRLNDLGDTIKCFVLTEDSNNEFLKKFLEFHGFNLNETEIISYEGVSNINSASTILGKHLKNKYPHSVIILHRDRDYLTEQELEEIKKKIENKIDVIHFFVMKGTDIESEFLNINHIHEITQIQKTDLELMLSKSIEQKNNESLKRFMNHFDRNPTQKHLDYKRKQDLYGLSESLKKEYESNKKEYMYGKKVFGVMKSKIQQHQKSTPDLLQKTEYIISKQLQELSQLIWS